MSVESTTVETTAEQSFQDYKASRLAEMQPKEEAKETDSSVVAEEQPEPTADSETAETSEGSDKQPETDSDSETEDEQDRDDKGRFKGKRGIEERFRQLTSRNKTQAQEISELRQQLEAVKASGVASQKVESGAKPKVDGEPKLEDFEDYNAYTRALARYEARVLFEEARAEEAKAESKRKAEAEQRTRAETWQQRVAEFSKQHDDFEEVLESIKVPITPAIQNTIMEAENGPALAYWLAQHGDDLKRISGLGELAAARELGKIEASLTQPKPVAAQAKPKVSAAPAPAKTVGGTAAAHKKPLTETDYQEYKKRRMAGER